MADQGETYQTLMDGIHSRAKRLLDDPGGSITGPQAAQGGELLRLAEAYAWLVNPSQPHGGGVPSR
jgi:hypothetical protein